MKRVTTTQKMVVQYLRNNYDKDTTIKKICDDSVEMTQKELLSNLPINFIKQKDCVGNTYLTAKVTNFPLSFFKTKSFVLSLGRIERYPNGYDENELRDKIIHKFINNIKKNLV